MKDKNLNITDDFNHENKSELLQKLNENKSSINKTESEVKSSKETPKLEESPYR
jgi:hypothetical protein